MFKKPVPLTKNSLLTAIRIGRRLEGQATWYVIGLRREEVPPTPIIIGEELLKGKGWFSEHEYDEIVRVDSYEGILEESGVRTQQEAVEYLYVKAMGWQKHHKHLRENLQQDPIRAVLSTNEVIEERTHFKGNRVIHEEQIRYEKGKFVLRDLLELLDRYESNKYQVDGKNVQEDKIEVLYKIRTYNVLEDDFEVLDAVKVTANVVGKGLDRKTLRLTWELADGKFGIHKDSYKKDPIYRYIQTLKGGN